MTAKWLSIMITGRPTLDAVLEVLTLLMPIVEKVRTCSPQKWWFTLRGIH